LASTDRGSSDRTGTLSLPSTAAGTWAKAAAGRLDADSPQMAVPPGRAE
jgi:hypothetical protein